MKKIKILIAVAVAVVSFILQAAPLRIAVYVDKGARNIGVFRWLELTTLAKDAVSIPVDGESIRAGALDSVDVLVMPGGSSVHEAKSLGEEGRAKVKSFIKNGGGYVGTCAGCCLLMEPASHHPDMLNIIPFKFGTSGGKAEMSIMFNRRANELAGIRKGAQLVRYAEGPVPLPSLPVKDAEMEVVATYNSDINVKTDKDRPSMAGQAAAIAGTYGKGKIFVLSVHPESDYNDHYILRGAFRYVSGREVEWEIPQRKPGQLAVGFMCDDSFGVETARLVQKLVKEKEFDIVTLNKGSVEKGDLRKVDAVLAPAGVCSSDPKLGLYAANISRTKEFLARGGRIFAWGSAADAAKAHNIGVTCVVDAEAALDQLRALQKEPLPKAEVLPKKVAKPIRAGIFQDPNNSNIIIARMLDLSPEYELVFLAPEDYVNGTLEGLDVVIQPGGGCTRQYKALGEKGAEALKNFVRNGGKYYGVCAGAFLALQQSRDDYPRLGLVPYKGDDPSHYRGKAAIKIGFTSDGKKVFENSKTSRNFVYAGGPVAISGETVEDTDVKVLAKYVGRIINVHNPMPVEPMTDKAAFLGGRVGKGKVFLSCPHPEMEERALDIVRDAFKYLTGVYPTPVFLERTRGAISVRYRSTDKASAEFLFNTLYKDSRFYVWPGKSLEDLSHVDVIVMTGVISDGDAKTLKAYISRGGKVVAVADTDAKRKAAEKVQGVKVVDSYTNLTSAILAK